MKGIRSFLSISVARRRTPSEGLSSIILDWLACLVTNIPNKGEQMVRNYGYYSNRSRVMRKKRANDDIMPISSVIGIKRKKQKELGTTDIENLSCGLASLS